MRQDIQFLRGVAVLFVVIYHSGTGVLGEGYLGVDIFFVISGFLITKLILEKLDKKSFSFAEFYYRRAKRLLPALYSTLIFTSLLGVFFLTQAQWADYLEQLIGALTFTANFVLPGQTGYFEQSSEGKPLLHIWSLSLEEQYYFLLPLVLFILPKKYRLIGLIVTLFFSILWCFTWIFADIQEAPLLWRLNSASKYEWAFYLLPTRAWELLAGSICAWVFINKSHLRTPLLLNYLAIAVIFLLGVVEISVVHPGVPAVLVVLCTSILLLGKGHWVPQNKVSYGVQKAGDWSYSIYLIHWPLFSFAHLGFIGDVPIYVSISIVFISLVCGYLQYRYVETPFRHIKIQKFTWSPFIILTALLALPSIAKVSHPLYQDNKLETLFRVNYGLNKVCSNVFDTNNRVKAECIHGEHPNIVLWGDSYAMHLAEGLKSNHTFVQLTKSECGPLKGIAIINADYDLQTAKKCINFNNKAIEYILGNNNVELVIMSSPLSYYFSDDNKILLNGEVVASNQEIALQSLLNTISIIKQHGKRVVFISPPPKNGKNIGQCLERLVGPSTLLTSSCTINKQDYFANQKGVLDILSEVDEITDVVMLDSLLCDLLECRVSIDGIPVYRDGGHLTYSGSARLLKNLNFNREKADEE